MKKDTDFKNRIKRLEKLIDKQKETIKKEDEQLKIINTSLNNVMKFLTSFFEDDENIQPIKKELQTVIDILNKK